jgi:rubrerythrin
MAENVFKFALEFEEEHQSFYKEMINKTENENLITVFEDLLEQEKKHAEIVKQLKQEKKVEDIKSNILPKSKETFEKISSDLPDNALPDEQVDIYKKAREMEERTYDFYSKKAEKTEIEHVKEAFKQLAKEEKKHENIMDNLVQFVNRPNTWLDDAEWYHIEDY